MNFNPFLTGMAEFTNVQLEAKIIDLQRKYFQTHNPQLQEQIAVTLDMFREELNYRQSIAYQQQKNQDGKSDLDGLINIS